MTPFDFSQCPGLNGELVSYDPREFLDDYEYMRKCSVCGKEKHQTDFPKSRSYCKACKRDKENFRCHAKGIYRPMSEFKGCPLHFGVLIGERLLPAHFPGVKHMPFGNIGYDFVCPKGSKIDVKISVLRVTSVRNRKYWHWAINKNEIPDYFALFGVDNRTDLNVMHFWIIPGHLVNQNISFTISDSKNALEKWAAYEKPTEKVIECCIKIKEVV